MFSKYSYHKPDIGIHLERSLFSRESRKLISISNQASLSIFPLVGMEIIKAVDGPDFNDFSPLDPWRGSRYRFLRADGFRGAFVLPLSFSNFCNRPKGGSNFFLFFYYGLGLLELRVFDNFSVTFCCLFVLWFICGLFEELYEMQYCSV